MYPYKFSIITAQYTAMKFVLRSFFIAYCFLPLLLNAQNAIGSINSGAISSNQYAHTIGEIFVIPETPGQPTPSGVLGTASFVAGSVGIGEAMLNPNQICFYPNPVSNSLFVESKEPTAPLQLSIYDVSGRFIAAQTVEGGAIDMSTYQSGTYLVSVKDGVNNISVRIIKQ